MYTKEQISFSCLGKTHILNFPWEENNIVFDFVLNFKNILFIYYKDQIEDITITFDSINLYFKNEYDHQKLRTEISKLLKDSKFNAPIDYKKWTLPVCLDDSSNADLDLFFKGNKSKVKEYLDRFLSLEFRLVFYGFLPGFPYLSGLPDEMSIPRKVTPNNQTFKGSVSVGGSQVGIYPQNSPGGWNVIGNCPVPLFDIKKEIPIFIQAGDYIQFFQISKEEWIEVTDAITKGIDHPMLKRIKND